MKHIIYQKNKFNALNENLMRELEAEEVTDDSDKLVINPENYDFYVRITMLIAIPVLIIRSKERYLAAIKKLNEIIDESTAIYDHSTVCSFYDDMENTEMMIVPVHNQDVPNDKMMNNGIHFAISTNHISRRELWKLLQNITKCLFEMVSNDMESFDAFFSRLCINKNLGNGQFETNSSNSVDLLHFFPTFLSLLNKEKEKEAEHETLISHLTKLFNLFIPEQEIKNYIYIIEQSGIDDILHYCINGLDAIQDSSSITDPLNIKRKFLQAFYFKSKTINLPDKDKETFIGKPFIFYSALSSNNTYVLLSPITSFGFINPCFPKSTTTQNVLKSLTKSQTKLKRIFASSCCLMTKDLSKGNNVEECVETFLALYLDFGFVKVNYMIQRCIVMFLISSNIDKRDESIAELHKLIPELNPTVANDYLNLALKMSTKLIYQ